MNATILDELDCKTRLWYSAFYTKDVGLCKSLGAPTRQEAREYLVDKIENMLAGLGKEVE